MVGGFCENRKVGLDRILNAVFLEELLRALQIFADVCGHRLGLPSNCFGVNFVRVRAWDKPKFHYIPRFQQRPNQTLRPMGNLPRGSLLWQRWLTLLVVYGKLEVHAACFRAG
jgi:hypothetical protein